MNLEQFVDQVLREGVQTAELTHHRIAGRPAQARPFPAELHPRLAEVLRARGIRELYAHQEQAFATAREGRDLVVVTPTASGKTLCYNLPVLDALLRDGQSRALYIFPTKALAQDQRAELSGLLDALGGPGTCHTYDGDTPAETRMAVRQAGHIVITNPDMLHAAILPHHARWVRLFENLRYVVIDELHTYRGVFGSHLANVLRRLARVAAFYGANPVFLTTSATIRNPAELAGDLLGRPVRLIDENGAPSGPRHFFFYNPPLVHPALGVRRSGLAEAVAWTRRLLGNDIATILFAPSRLQVELALTYLQRGLPASRAAQVRGYRGGYLPRERRAIESGLRSGQVRGVVSTNALELGIDIGSLQAAVLAGYPGSIASTWQQAGRAGRRGESSLVVFVAGNSPLDQYLVRHPEYLLSQSPESGYINPENLYVLMNHLKCAAFELPFRSDEGFGPGPAQEMLGFLAEERILRQVGGRFHWMADHFPAADVRLRGGDGNVVIIDCSRQGSPRVIGEVDLWGALLTVHEEAIYLHEGVPYQVERFDDAENKAYVRRVDVDYYTDADLAVHLKVLEVFGGDRVGPEPTGEDLRAVRGPLPPGPGADEDSAVDGSTLRDGLRDEPPGGGRSWGEVLVTAKAAVYKKIKLETHENVGWGKIHLPEREVQTTAYWLTFPERSEAELGREALAAALTGVARALAALAPLYLLCDRRDLQAVPQVRAPFTGCPTIFLWETHAGGVGLAEKAYEAHASLLRAVAAQIAGCGCGAGCPSCVGPRAPGEQADAKAAALALLELLPGGPQLRAEVAR